MGCAGEVVCRIEEAGLGEGMQQALDLNIPNREPFQSQQAIRRILHAVHSRDSSCARRELHLAVDFCNGGQGCCLIVITMETFGVDDCGGGDARICIITIVISLQQNKHLPVLGQFQALANTQNLWTQKDSAQSTAKEGREAPHGTKFGEARHVTRYG